LRLARAGEASFARNIKSSGALDGLKSRLRAGDNAHEWYRLEETALADRLEASLLELGFEIFGCQEFAACSRTTPFQAIARQVRDVFLDARRREFGRSVGGSTLRQRNENRQKKCRKWNSALPQ